MRSLTAEIAQLVILSEETEATCVLGPVRDEILELEALL